MVLEYQFPAFSEWLPSALYSWGLIVLALLALTLLAGFLWNAIQFGPRQAVVNVFRSVKSTIGDLFGISPKRIYAIALLSFKEAIRRKILIGFLVFIIILLFAGMFLDPQSLNPARLYINFIFWVNSALVLVLMLFVSTFSIPNDFKNKTIFTISTKPVRASEMVLGRMVGFIAMGTVLLLVMGVISYGFVQRSLAHTHTLSAEDLKIISTGDMEKSALEGVTSRVREHRHKVVIPAGYQPGPNAAPIMVEAKNGHSHQVKVVGSGKDRKYQLTGIRDMFVARVPVYGQLRFRDTTGFDTKKGICVGDEWTYRSFIQGNSNAATIWTFDNVTPARFPHGLPVEMTLGVFRTHKGNIERGVTGSLSVRNPDTGLTVDVHLFESVEFDTKKLMIPVVIDKPASRPTMIVQREKSERSGEIITTPDENKVNPAYAQKAEFNLFEDLVTKDGRVEVWVRCMEPMQYFGAAAADLYLRAGNASFTANFVKGFACIWMEMVLVVVFGVAFSTFVSAPIAILGTLAVLTAGFFYDYVVQLSKGGMIGGGPMESAYRLMRQDNMTSELDDTAATNVLVMVDRMSQSSVWAVSNMAPDMKRFATAEYVASGFNIPWQLMLMDLATVFGFVVPFFILGYLCMKMRENAA